MPRIPQRIRPFAIPMAEDETMVNMTTADGQEVVIPRAAAERAGVEVRPRVADAGGVAPASPGAPFDPTLERSLNERAGVADVPPMSVPAEAGIPPSIARPEAPLAPAPPPAAQGTTGDPQLDAFVQGLAQPPPTAPDPQAVQAPAPTPPRQADPFTPTVGPGAGGVDPGTAAALRSFQRQEAAHNTADPLGSEYVTFDGQRVTPGAQPAPAPATSQPRRSAPAEQQLDPNAQLIEGLVNRPEGAPPLAPQDFRRSSPLERALQRGDRARQRAQAAAENVQAAAIDRESIAAEAEAQQREMEARRAEAMNSATQAYAAAVREARSAEVNPARLFQNGGGIAVAIASVLGSLGSALTDGPNTALETINRAIDRDISAQQTNQANAQRTAQNARAFIDITRQRFTDERAAAEAARSMALDQVAQRIEQQSASLQSAAAQDEAAAMADQLRQQALQAARAAAIAEQERLLNQRQQVAQIRKLEAEATRAERRAAGGGGSGAGRLSRQAQLARQLEQAGVSREAALQVAGLGGLPTDQESELSGQERGNVAAAEEALARVESLVPAEGDIPGFGIFDSALPDVAAGAEGRRLRQAVRSLIEVYGRLHSGGAISDDEFQLFNQVIGSGRFQTEQELRDGLRAVRRELQARRSGRGGSSAAGGAQLPEGVRPVP